MINYRLVDLNSEVGFAYNNVDKSMEERIMKQKEWVM